MISLKRPREIELMREAGRLVSHAHRLIGGMVEPGVTTAELDAGTASLVVTALRAEAESGATVVLSTNDPSLAAMCDRAYRLHGGVIDPVSEVDLA